MIAAGYARPDIVRIQHTFAYTNIVPQFVSFNRGKWKKAEGWIINDWGDKCHQQAKGRKARIHIIVGAVPTSPARSFGASGFSNYEDTTRYRIVVPKTMWTAACCGLDDNTVISVMAFSRENLPEKDPVIEYPSPQKMVDTLFPPPNEPVNLFPTNAKCMLG